MLSNHPDVVCQPLLLRIRQKMPLRFTLSWWLLFRGTQQAVRMQRSQRHPLHHRQDRWTAPDLCLLSPDQQPGRLQSPFRDRGIISARGTDERVFSRATQPVWTNFKVCIIEHGSVSHSVLCDSLWPHKLKPIRILCPWDFLGKSTGGGSHSLLQGFFPIQGLNLSLLQCGQILYRLSQQGSPLKPQC